MRNNSIDGFKQPGGIPRRPLGQGQLGSGFERPKERTPIDKSLPFDEDSVDFESLGDLNPSKPTSPVLGRQKKRSKLFGRNKSLGKKYFWSNWSRRKKIIMSLAAALIILLIIIGGFLLWKLFGSAGHIFKGNLLGSVFSKPLQADQHGRSNILVFGTSEDDPGHQGAELTDSIMIVSVHQKKRNAKLVSVPRDFWVKFDQTCDSGTEGKINEVYMCAKENASNRKKAEDSGQAALRKKVGEIFGIDVQYSVHINYQVLRNSIDSVGGVDINVNSQDPRGILDRNFDWRCNYECFLVKHPNGRVHLDGEHALYLAQARNEAGGYGLPRGNFDREMYQRKIMIAAVKKATSVGFLTNPVRITRLIDSLGKNIRTNFRTAEIKTLINIGKKTNAQDVKSLSLIDQNPALLTDEGISPTGASIVQPTAGLYNYGDLQSFIQAKWSGQRSLLEEKATVDVLNSSEVPGLAQAKADELSKEGIKVNVVGNAPEGSPAGLKLYDLTGGKKPASKQKLEKLLGISATTEPVPSGIVSEASFVLVVSQ